MILHSQDKPFKCAYCDDYFKSRFARLKHQEKFHLGPFPCDICGRQFNDTGNRKHHIECTHGGRGNGPAFCVPNQFERGEKPHRCVICNQTFRIMKTLTKHMVIHSDVRPLSCPHCSTTFKRKDKLKYHVDHVHSGRPLKQQQPNLSVTPANKLTESSDTPKAYHNTPKTVLQSVALIPVQMTEESILAVHGTPHRVLPAVSQQQQTGYQSTTDLVFLEKYTLTPQPTINMHPARPEQVLDPREQSYLGTLLGLDSAPAEQNMSSA
ncbi:hypothetical protein cypCar_00042275 [Cyprinus carpio]|nr:hypothetical protein cypCar_00042275 [Cyprinus carpio]